MHTLIERKQAAIAANPALAHDVILVRDGIFYEALGERDAYILADATFKLDGTVISITRARMGDVLFSGIPYHRLTRTVDVLRESGYSVTILD